MKKSPIIFIAMLIALAFTSCQMNTDDTGANPVVPTTPTSETEYAITIVASHGTVKLDKAKAGETVRILNYIADEGYHFKSVNAYKDDNTLVEPNPDHTSFVMPSCNVKIVAEYEVIPNDDSTQTETPTDDTGDGEEVEDPVDDTPTPTDTTTTDTDDNNASSTPDPTYGFVSSVDYEIYAPDGTTKIMSKKGSELNEAAKELGLVKDTDYSINETTGIITLTASGYEKVKSYIGNDNLPATPTTDGDDNGVVYAACKITLPNIDPETGKIVVTNKGKDGNSVVEKVYKDVTGAVYLGADEGDIIEIELCPKVINAWEYYDYFEYENELTVKDAFGQKISLTRVVKAVSYSVYTFTMPKTYVNVGLPHGFEMRYSYTIDKQDDTKAEILNQGFYAGMKAPGEVVYVMVVGYEVSSIDGLKKNGTYKFEDITKEVLATRYVYTNSDGLESVFVKIGNESYRMVKGSSSWDSTGVHFYSFIMPRDSITIKL